MARKKKPMPPCEYVRQTLQPGEEVYALARIHWAILVDPLFGVLAGIAASVFIGKWFESMNFFLWFAVLLILSAVALRYIAIWIYLKTTESAVTTARVLHKSGLISRDTDEIALAKVESVRLRQSVMGRIFNYGTIHVVGTGGQRVSLYGVAEPMEFRAVLQQVAMNG